MESLHPLLYRPSISGVLVLWFPRPPIGIQQGQKDVLKETNKEHGIFQGKQKEWVREYEVYGKRTKMVNTYYEVNETKRDRVRNRRLKRRRKKRRDRSWTWEWEMRVKELHSKNENESEHMKWLWDANNEWECDQFDHFKRALPSPFSSVSHRCPLRKRNRVRRDSSHRKEWTMEELLGKDELT